MNTNMEKAYNKAAALAGFCNWDSEAQAAVIANYMERELAKTQSKIEKKQIAEYAAAKVKASFATRTISLAPYAAF